MSMEMRMEYMGLLVSSTIIALCTVAGCNEDAESSADAGADWGVLSCGDGLAARGPACTPVFARCKAGEVALLGGTCKRVGPPTKCPAGWKLAKEGWCEPLLPAATCPNGTLVVLGSVTCQPIMDCGSGKYGNIKVTAKTIHVDRKYSRADSNGSKERPYQSIEEALAAAPSGAHIAVAAGEYQEDLVITRPVTLEGRCPRMVTVKGYKTDRLATIHTSASNTTLRGLTVTGTHIGVSVLTASGVVVDRCAISDNLSMGMVIQAKSEVTLRRSVVARNATRGVGITYSTLTVDACTIEGTKATKETDGWTGWGLWGEGGQLDVTDSLISANDKGGLGLKKARGTMTRSVIRDTRDLQIKNASAQAVGLMTNASLSISRSLISNNRVTGITIIDSAATLDQSVIRGTQPRRYDQTGGSGITVFTSRSTAPCKLEIKDSMISDSSSVGVVHVNGGQTSILRSVIRGTGSTMGKNSAVVGIWAFTRPSAEHPVPQKTVITIDHSVVEASRHMGVAGEGGVALNLSRSVIRDIKRPGYTTGNLAHGIWLRQREALTKLGLKSILRLTECLVEKIEGVGVAAYETVSAHLVRSLVRDVVKHAEDGMAGIAGIGTPSGGPSLSVEDSTVSNVPGVGIHLEGATATVTRTMVTDMQKPYGDGIQVKHGAKLPESRLSLTRGLIHSSARAGLFFYGGTGKVCQSLFKSSEYAIVVDHGAKPVICDDNRYEENKRNSVAFGQGLEPARIPMVKDLSP